jgi:glycosyltransferase involved in cell wall biosynthesis
MRILIAVHQFFPEFASGTETVAYNLAKMLQKNGHTVCILTTRLRGSKAQYTELDPTFASYEDGYEGLRLLRLPVAILNAQSYQSLEFSPSLMGILAPWLKDNFDVLHVLHPMRMASVIAAALHARIPYLLTLTDFYLLCPNVNLLNEQRQLCQGPKGGHECANACAALIDLQSALDRFAIAQRILQGAFVCVAPSQSLANHFEQAMPGLSIQVLGHGVDLLTLISHRHMSSAGQSQDTRISAGSEELAKKTLHLGFVGSLVNIKGLHILLKALSLISSSELILEVVGPHGDDVIYRQDLESQFSSDQRVRYLGQLSPKAVFTAMAQWDLLCVPSLVPESFSLVTHEAQALGVPVLCSDQGAVADLVDRHGCGRKVPIGNVQAWRFALEAILEDRAQLVSWQQSIGLPLRIEEEAFFYESWYWQACNSQPNGENIIR